MSEIPEYYPINEDAEQQIVGIIASSGERVAEEIYDCGGINQYCHDVERTLHRRLTNITETLLADAYPSWDQDQWDYDPLWVVKDGLMMGLGLAAVSLDGRLGAEFNSRLLNDLHALDYYVVHPAFKANLSAMLMQHRPNDDDDGLFKTSFNALPDALSEKYRDTKSLELYAGALGYVVNGVTENLLRSAVKQVQPIDHAAFKQILQAADNIKKQIGSHK